MGAASARPQRDPRANARARRDAAAADGGEAAGRRERGRGARAPVAQHDGEAHPRQGRAERGGGRRCDGARRRQEEAGVEEAWAAKGEGREGLESDEGMEEVLRARGIGRRWSDGGELRRQAARTGREQRLGLGRREGERAQFEAGRGRESGRCAGKTKRRRPRWPSQRPPGCATARAPNGRGRGAGGAEGWLTRGPRAQGEAGRWGRVEEKKERQRFNLQNQKHAFSGLQNSPNIYWSKINPSRTQCNH
jgi:hypothetical protein